MFHIKFSEKEGIIYVQREGEITAEDIVGYIIELDEKFNHLESVLILEKVDDSKSMLRSFDQFNLFEAEITKRASKYKHVKNAIVVESPFEKAIIYMLQEITNRIKGYRIEVFPTEDLAMKWLKI